MSGFTDSIAGKKRKSSIQIGSLIYDGVICFILLLVLIACFYPFWYILILSLNDATDSLKGGLFLFPRVFTIDSYISVVNNGEFLHAAWISLARTVIGTLYSLFFTTLLAYGMSKKDLVGAKTISVFFIITMYFGGGLIPYYMVLKAIGLIDTFWVYIIPGAISVYNMILIRIYIESLPAEMEESAKLDGANEITILFRIIIPLCMPVLATVCLFFAVGQWNSWFDTNLYTYSKKLKTLQFLLVQILNNYDLGSMQSQAELLAKATERKTTSSDSVRMATTMVATLPIILVYPFLQKYFVKGIMIGAVKS